MKILTNYALVRGRCCLPVRYISPVLLGLGLLLAQSWAVAQLPALYGDGYVRLGQSWKDGSPHQVPAAPVVVSGADVRAYRERVKSLERTGGPYSDGLAEPLSSLARYDRGLGKYTEALDLYRRALHLVRVNDGLNNGRQIPLVRELLDTYRLAGDMQALDQLYEYYFRLYGNGYPPYTPARLQAGLEYLRWQREAIRLGMDGEPKNRLVAMYRLNKRILESAGQSSEMTPSGYTQLVLSQIRNLYLIQSETGLPTQDSPFQSGRSIYSSRLMHPDSSIHSSKSIHPSPGVDMDFKQQQLEEIQRTSASKGRGLLEALIARMDASAEVADRARIHLELGDWQQWNGNRQSANKEYAIVVQLLRDAGKTQLLEKWLGYPSELPANGAFWQAFRQTRDSRRVVLTAEFNVTARGNARKIRVSFARPEDKAFIGRLRRKLAATRFRPRFVNGKAEAVERLRRQYEIIVN